jgi:subtilisin family serine protease
MPNKLEKGVYVYTLLTEVARRTQGPLVAELETQSVSFRRFWIYNMIWVRGDAQLLQELASRTDVASVAANPSTHLDWTGELKTANRQDETAVIEWNVVQINAPGVWDLGFVGQGAVVGGQDTGYDWEHPALIDQYRGNDDGSIDHDYSWHDAIHEDNDDSPPGNPCGYDSPEPCDDNGHGTHTMGTMAGDDGLGNQVGVAPQARWIGCRNMEQGVGTPATYAECYEWFVAPYPQGGDPFTDGKPEEAPDVINNSWSCPVSEGCVEPNILRSVVEHVRAAGIVTVHAAGNAGPACSSISTPAAIYDASFTVGATDTSDTIAGFSSRGPVDEGGNAAA